MSDVDQLYIARVMFMNRVLQADGQAYEDLLASVMQCCYDFRKIKPHGSDGDRKNDGYIPDLGQFFQVYAPEEPTQPAAVTKAVAKAREAFDGIKEYWSVFCEVKDYRFAYNDKYRGTYPDIEKELASIKSKHELDDARAFFARHLEDEFMGLDLTAMMNIVGIIPSAKSIRDLPYDILSEVLQHLVTACEGSQLTGPLQAPDYGNKLSHNEISEEVASLIKTASFNTGELENFFSRNSSFAREEIRDHLAELYITVRNGIEVQEGVALGDLIFFRLLEQLLPSKQSRQTQNAAIVLIAYFFETCDVFEAP